MVGKPAFNFSVAGSGGKAQFSIDFQTGKDASFTADNQIQDYKIDHDMKKQGTTLICTVNINQKI